MNEALETKLNEYLASKFENPEFRTWLRDSDLWMAIYSVLRIRGTEMDKRELVEILGGKLMENVPLDLYGFVHSFKDLYKEMQACIGMQESLNEKNLNRFANILFELDSYRSDNPIIYKWAYIAPHFTVISNSLQELFRSCDKIANPVLKAIAIHDGIATVYPYGEYSSAIAMICMYYVLMQNGIPLPSITVDDEDYNKLMSLYFDKGIKDIDDMFERSLLNRLESVLLLGKESMEK